jgi:hypothetical protein
MSETLPPVGRAVRQNAAAASDLGDRQVLVCRRAPISGTRPRRRAGTRYDVAGREARYGVPRSAGAEARSEHDERRVEHVAGAWVGCDRVRDVQFVGCV